MNETTTELMVEDVYPNPKHYREVRDADVKTLAASIAVVGQLEPISVFRDGEIYIVDSGHHRLAAVKSLGLETIKAIIIEDSDEASSAQVMVASNMHFAETEIEKSRGAQLMLSTGVRPMDVAAIIGEGNTDKVEKVARGFAIAQDYAEDMTLERLAVLPEFEEDPEAVKKLMTTPEDRWKFVYRELCDEKTRAINVDTAERIVREAGCELIKQNLMDKHHYLTRGDEKPEGAKYARITTFSWNSSAEITWYDDVTEQTEDPEAAARREQDALIKAELEKAAERRIEFLFDHLTGNGCVVAHDALKEFAQKSWLDGVSADNDAIGEVLDGVQAIVPRIYAAILSEIEGWTERVLGNPTGWYLTEHGQWALDYFAALGAVGFAPTDVENGVLAEIEEALTPEPEDEDES